MNRWHPMGPDGAAVDWSHEACWRYSDERDAVDGHRAVVGLLRVNHPLPALVSGAAGPAVWRGRIVVVVEPAS